MDSPPVISCDDTASSERQTLAFQSLRQNKRVERACDKCSTSRTRCDGKQPCAHCTDYGFNCAYTRIRRKRGRIANSAKVSRIEEDREAAQSQSQNLKSDVGVTKVNEVGNEKEPRASGYLETATQQSASSGPTSYQQSYAGNNTAGHVEPQQTYVATPNNLPTYTPSQSVEQAISQDILHTQQYTPQSSAASVNLTPLYVDLGNENTLQNFTREVDVSGQNGIEINAFERPALSNTLPPLTSSQLQTRPSYRNFLPPILGTTGLDAPPYARSVQSSVMRLSTSMSSPQTDISQASGATTDCWYPVLQPLLPYVTSFISTKELCNLVDIYFTEPSNSLFECASPYVLTQIFRKKSFLRQDRPRKTSPALLAAMVWVAAQTSDAQIFKTSARARASICDQLLKVCLELLDAEDIQKRMSQPSSHTYHSNSRSYLSKDTDDGSEPEKTVETVDDILTFALIGTVISGGDTRRKCLKWWTSAWELAKKLELNREVDDSELRGLGQSPQDAFGGQHYDFARDVIQVEEAKEERRRTWWLLYIADRHLALSYNAKLNILDAECRIYLPLDEATWQDLDVKLATNSVHRFLGPSTTITGVGLFEYFLPLMTILGDIVEIHHLTCHPRFSLLNLGAAVAQAEDSLNVYEESLKAFEDSLMFDVHNISTPQGLFNGHGDTRSWPIEHTRRKVVIAYSKHLVHVLYILLHGSWDPITMLDGVDQWVTPESFVKCATHAISAATAVSEILSLDPELSFMPYLFGIYLLHGSFILLIFADRMDVATSETVSGACETIIRAHEVCVTTLNTEYQRNFRKVLRSALNNVRGTVTVGNEQHKNRRRELLSRFQWTKDGKGLLA